MGIRCRWWEKLYLYRRKVLFLYFFTKLKILLEKLLHFNNQTGIFIFVATKGNKQNKRKTTY
ncbi:hypothetical protein CN324_02800 [Bacillus anthracis]|nr:hypothetical protein CON22_24395 [Bacillus cereus]PEZ62659.1 hypothetical protein CN372_15770 [Bacillus anthracis]PHA14890.1 hypothetical protein COE65_04870 [Bacillus sp. AFS051223]PFA46022.1 hypothetical protein CN391_28630 [Bacillus anthracis]PFA95680.1 hypothetical protein CN385_25465 [Bacillus anthracis]